MKIIKYINLYLLVIILGACAVTLTDETANSFIAIATQGEYSNKVEVSWIQTPYYKSYQVFRSESVDGTYLPLTEGNINTTIFIDNTMNIGQEYYYKVEGYNELGISSFTTESAKGHAGVGGGFSPPSNVTVNIGESTREISLKWNRVLEAYEYEILRSVDNLIYTPIARVSHLRYRDEDVEQGILYYYQISSVNKEGIYSSARSTTITASLYGGDIGLSSKAGAYIDKVELTWNMIPYTQTYSIYRSENSDTIGRLIITIEDANTLTYEDFDVVPGKLYYYTVIYGNKTVQQTSSKVRSYLFTADLPAKVQNFNVSQGVDPNDVNLSWDSVLSTGTYEVSRALSRSGPWTIITTTAEQTFNDKIPNDQYTYFYKIVALNPAPGPDSDILEGWANKPPVNIIASTIFGSKVALTWDKVPNARQYQIEYADTEDGTYKFVTIINANNKERFSYDHIFDIGSQLAKDMFYRINVISATSSSIFSSPVKGQIKKIEAPQNIRLMNNQVPTKLITVSWDGVPNAIGYAIYVATLSHKDSDPNRLQAVHFKKVGTSSNPSYQIAFGSGSNPPLYPIRRHVFMVKAIDPANAEGVDTKTGIVHRLPVDTVDFAKDVDFTIIQAQTQIANFGYMNSGATIYGRGSGNYEYYAGMSGSKNIWRNYVSFEVILDGAQSVGVDIGNLSATLNGTLHVKGLYSGSVYYDYLNAKQGGYAFGGKIRITYNGVVDEVWDVATASGHMQAVVQDGTESPPRPPSYEAGGG